MYTSRRLAIPFYWQCAVLSLALFIAMLGSLAFGAASLSFSDLVAWIIGQGEEHVRVIIEQLRLPRIVCAASVGAMLSLAGACAQGLFRNPLADPSLIGVSAGASLGASLAIVGAGGAGVIAVGYWVQFGVVSVGAFSGALLAAFLVYRFATFDGATSVATMLLAGVALSYLAGGVSTFLEYMANDQELRQLSLWKMGGLEMITPAESLLALAAIILMGFGCWRFRHALDAFLLGESEARYLGVNVPLVKRTVIAWVAFSVALSVALCGVVAFVGLLVPHLARLIAGPLHKFLLPLSALLGALLLVLADLAARLVLAPSELPVGLLTALFGSPLFLWLLYSQLLAHRGQHA